MPSFYNGSITCGCNTEVRSAIEVLYAVVILKYVLQMEVLYTVVILKYVL